MALEIYIEDDFEHEAEAKQAADLCSRLSALIPADANYKLLLNFYVDGKQLDALLITPQRFIIIDFNFIFNFIIFIFFPRGIGNVQMATNLMVADTEIHSSR